MALAQIASSRYTTASWYLTLPPSGKVAAVTYMLKRKGEQEKNRFMVDWTDRVIQMRSMLHIMGGFIHCLRSSKRDLIDDHDSVCHCSINVLGVNICFGGN